ncbi:MAG TPA: hypothetical protein VHZ55_21885 [Bryobacteraceae bacterium]|nr:hypothetical protein [Bryobacteraceae bacterium]
MTTNPAWDDSPAWSPDGQLIAFLRFNTPVTADVLVIPALGGAERKIGTINTRQEGSAMATKRVLSPGNLAWTPDGKWIAFGGRRADDEGRHDACMSSQAAAHEEQRTPADQS